MLFRSLFHKALAVAALGLAAAGGAQARDVYWSVGVNASPNVVVGVGNHRPVIVQPAPVYGVPHVIYTQPPVVYTQPPVVYPSGFMAGPVIVQAPAYRGYYGHDHGHGHGRHWRSNGHGHGHGHKHWRKHGRHD